MVKTCFPIKGVRVQSLIRELRFHLPEGQEKKKKNRDSIVTNSIMTLKMVHIKKKKKKGRQKNYSQICLQRKWVIGVRGSTGTWCFKRAAIYKQTKGNRTLWTGITSKDNPLLKYCRDIHASRLKKQKMTPSSLQWLSL